MSWAAGGVEVEMKRMGDDAAGTRALWMRWGWQLRVRNVRSMAMGLNEKENVWKKKKKEIV